MGVQNQPSPANLLLLSLNIGVSQTIKCGVWSLSAHCLNLSSLSSIHITSPETNISKEAEAPQGSPMYTDRHHLDNALCLFTLLVGSSGTASGMDAVLGN